MTFALLEVLSLRRAPGGGATRARVNRGLAFAALGGATLRLLKARLEKHLGQGSRRAHRWGSRTETLREPVETALTVALLGALALPLMVEQEPKAPTGRKPVPPRGTETASARSVDDGEEDGDDLGLNGAIASW
ncbi:hypothetical protein [Pyxidicoccus sp. MSG2]|uniref:hypothetical protein n=1 Tax=Pyxidicoccus sp. MSG2 TaxID=2996790 RepID=UPI00226F15CC|nr:hypothetical protein [Pyxidicoccus sp. MSG2]MCY1017186.1 hypothetical protein [Pyxidicoccus sp. MSG2]